MQPGAGGTELAAQSRRHRAGFISRVNREAQREAKGSTKGGKVSPRSSLAVLPPAFFCSLKRDRAMERGKKKSVVLPRRGSSSPGAGAGKGGRSSLVPGRPLG